MDQQVIEAQPDSDADALAAFERMSGQLAMLTAAVERLSGWSSGLSECGACLARFGVEPDEEFAGEGDAYDHLLLALSEEPVAECGEVVVIFSGDVGDEEQDRSHRRPAAAHRAPAFALSAVVGEGCEAGELGDGLVREGAEFGQIGEQDGDGPIGEALDRTDGPVELCPERIDGDQRRDLGRERPGLVIEEGDGLLEARQRDRLAGGVEALLLDREIGRDLPQPCGERGQPALVLGRRRRGDELLRFGPSASLRINMAGDHLGIDPIGLLQSPHGVGEAAHRARVGDGAGLALLPQRQEGRLLDPARGLHHDQLHALLAAEGQQLPDPFRGVGETLISPSRPAIEPGLRNIHSTNDAHHGNLPCLYDWKSTDCSVVRDNGDDPKLHHGGHLRGNGRHRRRRGGWPPTPAILRFNQSKRRTSRYKGFAARQARIEQRDYSRDLAQLTERQEKMTAAINTLADQPGVKLTPDGFAESVERAAAKLRVPDQAALASAQAAMGEARTAMMGVVAGARTKQAQRDAMIWAVTISMGVTTSLLALAPLLINTLWPAAAEDRAAAILHKSRWEAGMELMASGDPARWRQVVDADTFQHDTAQAVAVCRNRADSAGRPVHCAIEVAPTVRAPGLLSPR